MVVSDEEIAQICEGLGHVYRLKLMRTLQSASGKTIKLAQLIKETNKRVKKPRSFSSGKSHVEKLAFCGLVSLIKNEDGEYIVKQKKEWK